jgi:hypothetical protein
MAARTLRRGALAFAAYAALVVWLTWPLARHVTTHLPSTTSLLFDTLHTVWVLSWETRSLTTAPLALPDANIYHPSANALFYGQTAFGALPYFAPVLLATGNPTLALNVMFLAGVALTACALHLVVHHWTRSDLAGALAAWAFLTTRWVLWEVVPTAPQYALLHWFPPIILLASTPAARFPLALLALLILQALVDPVYLGIAIMIPLALLGGARLMRPETRAAGARLLGVLVVTAVALIVAFATHMLVRADNPALASQTLWATSMAPIAFPWGLVSCASPTAVPTVLLVLIAAGAASVLVAGATPPVRRAWGHVALWTAIGVALALKPSSFPILEMLRVPARNGVAALIGVALLAGLAFAECARRVAGWGRAAPVGLAAALALAAYLEHRQGLADPSFQRPPLPPYGMANVAPLSGPIAAALDRSRGPLLELPVGEGQRAAMLHARAMYRSIFHDHPIVNGYAGYFPADFPSRMALAHDLPDADALRALHDATGLELLLVNAADFPPPEQIEWYTLADAGGRADLRLVERDGPWLLFAVATRTATVHAPSRLD